MDYYSYLKLYSGFVRVRLNQVFRKTGKMSVFVSSNTWSFRIFWENFLNAIFFLNNHLTFKGKTSVFNSTNALNFLNVFKKFKDNFYFVLSRQIKLRHEFLYKLIFSLWGKMSVFLANALKFLIFLKKWQFFYSVLSRLLRCEFISKKTFSFCL